MGLFVVLIPCSGCKSLASRLATCDGCCWLAVTNSTVVLDCWIISLSTQRVSQSSGDLSSRLLDVDRWMTFRVINMCTLRSSRIPELKHTNCSRQLQVYCVVTTIAYSFFISCCIVTSSVNQHFKSYSVNCFAVLLRVLWHCCLVIGKNIRPLKIEWWGAGMVVCLEQGADDSIWSSSCHCHPVISWFIKIQTGLLAYPGVPEKRPLNSSAGKWPPRQWCSKSRLCFAAAVVLFQRPWTGGCCLWKTFQSRPPRRRWRRCTAAL